MALSGILAFGAHWVWAGTADVEKDNNAISVSSTVDNEDDADAMMSAEKGSRSAERGMELMSDPAGITFDYFLTSGYAANDIRNIPSVGQIDGTPEMDKSLSVAKSVYVLVNDDKTKLDPGVKLIAFGDEGELDVKAADFYKRFIRNLAVLQVREQVGKQRYLAEVVESYGFLPAGSRVKLYDSEKNLWERARTAKPLPTKMIKCYVAGGNKDSDTWTQNDYVILTAGTKQGVVEGTIFQLFEVTYDADNHKVRERRGWARVFYSGGNYCLAQILSDSESIASGFEAVYKP